jgi:hypothetical protein
VFNVSGRNAGAGSSAFLANDLHVVALWAVPGGPVANATAKRLVRFSNGTWQQAWEDVSAANHMTEPFFNADHALSVAGQQAQIVIP